MELSKNRRLAIYERSVRYMDTAQAHHNNLMETHDDLVVRCDEAYHRVEEAQNDLDTFGETPELLEAYGEADMDWQEAWQLLDNVIGDSANILKGRTHTAATAYEAYIA